VDGPPTSQSRYLVTKVEPLRIGLRLRGLAEKGYDPAFGARPMARVIEEEQLKKPLANEILFGDLKDGGTEESATAA
jgi:hypothetical protein